MRRLTKKDWTFVAVGAAAGFVAAQLVKGRETGAVVHDVGAIGAGVHATFESDHRPRSIGNYPGELRLVRAERMVYEFDGYVWHRRPELAAWYLAGV